MAQFLCENQFYSWTFLWVHDNSWILHFILFWPIFIWRYAHTANMTVPYDGLNSEHNPLFRLSDMIYIKNLTNPNSENSISPDSSTNQISQSGQITVDSTYTTYVF